MDTGYLENKGYQTLFRDIEKMGMCGISRTDWIRVYVLYPFTKLQMMPSMLHGPGIEWRLPGSVKHM